MSILRGRCTKVRAWMAVATTVGAVAATIGGAGAARADYGPRTYNNGKGDVVCVGSDTVQIMGNFLADGNPSGNAGFNTATGQTYKFLSLDATADANVRVAYAITSTVANPQPLDPSVDLRAGQKPQNRPNGSGSGYNALNADVTTTGRNEQINCVRGSALANQTQYDTANTNGWGGYHTVRAATDTVRVAVLAPSGGVAATNAPAHLSRAQLSFIYSVTGTVAPQWSAIPGGYVPPNPSAAPGTPGNCATCPIVALLPQNGSGTRGTFIADLQAAGCVCTSFGSWINQQSEENDPSAITNGSDPADTIIPFSSDRLDLWNSGFFLNPHTKYNNILGAPLTPGVVQTADGIASDGNNSYKDVRGLYFTWRAVDDSDQPWNNSTLNWVRALFLGPSSGTATTGLASGGAKNLINAASGGTQVYSFLDCGSGGPTGWAAAGCVNVVL